MKQKSADRIRLDENRTKSAKYFCEKYSREERYLIICERDCNNFLASEEYLRTKDTANQFYFDFLVFFDKLKGLMKEFRWSAKFLAEKGINFSALRNLYFAVA